MSILSIVGRYDMLQFFKTKTGRICLIAVGVILLASIGLGLWLGMQPKFRDLTIELGSPLPPVSEFLTSYGSDADIEKLYISFENLPESNIEVRLTDSSHTFEKILELPADRDPTHEFAILLEIERNAVVYVGTPIE